jgi:hypothetical protein
VHRRPSRAYPLSVFWTIAARAPQAPTDRGYAATREHAMAEFKAAWERE